MLLSLALLMTASALFFSLEPLKERCVGLTLSRGQSFSCGYVVSGEGEYNVVTRVLAPQGSVVYMSEHHSREGKYSATAADDGKYRLCFLAIDRRPKVVSFDFTSEALAPEPALAQGESMDELKGIARTMKVLLDQVQRNVKFTKEQERTHRDLAETTCDRVLWSALGKVIVLCAVAAVEMTVMKGLLADNKTSGV